MLRWVGGGSGSGVADLPNVANYAALPAAADHAEAEYICDAAQGIGVYGKFGNRKPAGIWKSNGTTWDFKGATSDDVGGVKAGGAIGQVYTKLSAADGDADWQDPAGGSTDPIELSANESVLSAPTDLLLKLFGRKRAGNRLFFINKENVAEELGYAFEQGWSSIAALSTTGGFRQAGDGSGSFGLTGTAGSTESATLALYGLTIPLSTSSGAGWRAGFAFAEKLFLANTSYFGTGGVVTFHFVTPAALTNLRIGVGLTGDSGITEACDNDVSAYSGLFVNFSSARGDTNFKYWARNTAAPTVLDSGLPVVAGKKYRVTIRLTKDPTIHIIRIDNLNDNTSSGDKYITLSMPNASTGLVGIVFWKDLATTIRKAYLGKQIKRCMGVYNP